MMAKICELWLLRKKIAILGGSLFPGLNVCEGVRPSFPASLTFCFIFRFSLHPDTPSFAFPVRPITASTCAPHWQHADHLSCPGARTDACMSGTRTQVSGPGWAREGLRGADSSPITDRFCCAFVPVAWTNWVERSSKELGVYCWVYPFL